MSTPTTPAANSPLRATLLAGVLTVNAAAFAPAAAAQSRTTVQPITEEDRQKQHEEAEKAQDQDQEQEQEQEQQQDQQPLPAEPSAQQDAEQDAGGDAEPLRSEPGGGLEVSPVQTESEPKDNISPETGLPGIELPSYRPPKSSLVREGAFLIDRRGYLFPLETGGFVFVFDPDETGEAEPPMIMMPCIRLMEMSRVLQARRTPPTFLVNGSVYVYRGRNYFKPDFFRTLLPRELEEEKAAEQAAKEAASANAQPAGEASTALFADEDVDTLTGQSVDDIINQIDTAAERNEIIFRPAASRENDEAELAREGVVLVSRKGHVERGRTGGWVFSPDNGVELSEADRIDEPLLLLPNDNLHAIEELSMAHGSDLSFIISGVVTVYEGRNYLLPTMYMVDMHVDHGLNSAQ